MKGHLLLELSLMQQEEAARFDAVEAYDSFDYSIEENCFTYITEVSNYKWVNYSFAGNLWTAEFAWLISSLRIVL